MHKRTEVVHGFDTISDKTAIAFDTFGEQTNCFLTSEFSKIDLNIPSN